MDDELKAGRYRIEDKIDRGGMGDVYRAYDTRLKCTVALKKIKPEYLDDPEFRRRLALEAHAAAAIDHPGIAKAIDFFDDDIEAFVVYEFVEGASLHHLLSQKRFAIGEILDVGIRIADALAAAHAKGIIHRDLKPKNIMLTPRPEGPSRVKILDFGLAKKSKVISVSAEAGPGETSLEGITKSHAVILGTLEYMSPEQATPEPVDSRTDIYSLGLVLYEMAAGFNPFAGHNDDSTRLRVLRMDPPQLPQAAPGVPEYVELDRIVRKCMRKRPEERHQSAHELLADLTKLRDAQRELPPPPRPGTFIPRWLACALFSLIQVGYLAMYAAAFSYLPENAHRLPKVIQDYGVTQFVLATLIVLCVAATVRLYLLAAVAFDYEDLGRLFHRIFPAILLLDVAWAMSPLLLFLKLRFIVLLGVPALAYLPFSQRTLVFWAYGRRGGRSSAAKIASSAVYEEQPNLGAPHFP